MLKESELQEALDKVATLFTEQCENGAQAKNLGPTRAAVGQFIGPSSKSHTHHGLHGTAAALRVLSQTEKPAARSLVPKLVQYISNRLDGSLQGSSPKDDSTNNVIKLGEILYSLGYVQPSHCSTESLVQSIATKLLGARKENKGWTYFADSVGEVDALPTAFAIWGLCKHGYENQIEPQIKYLEEQISAEDENPDDAIHETSVRIFCLFVLAFRRDDLDTATLKRLKSQFSRLWKTHEALLEHSVEQNIEYYNNDSNYYIRIPWQLYILTLAGKLHPRRFSSLAARNRLRKIAEAVKGEGFRYPYSGHALSSRTNGILYDALDKISRIRRKHFLHWFFYALDAVRTFVSLPIVSAITLITFIVSAIVCIYYWFRAAATPQDLGRGLITSMIMLIVSSCIARLRKS